MERSVINMINNFPNVNSNKIQLETLLTKWSFYIFNWAINYDPTNWFDDDVHTEIKRKINQLFLMISLTKNDNQMLIKNWNLWLRKQVITSSMCYLLMTFFGSSFFKRFFHNWLDLIVGLIVNGLGEENFRWSSSKLFQIVAR